MDRRSFLASIGALSAAQAFSAGLVQGVEPTTRAAPGPDVNRGLANAADVLLAPGLAYLQTGSVGPSPNPVVDRTLAAWIELEKNPVHQGYRIQLPALEQVRDKAAAMLRCTHDEIILTRGTTDGMNAVAVGLDLGPGDRVLTTDQEHGGGHLCWEYLARRRGIVLDHVPIPLGENDAPAIVDRFRKAITPKTRVLSFSHVLYTTGLRMPVSELSALACEHGCLAIVDGAQALGGIDVDVQALGCHVYATTGHKWMLGPKGTGLLFVREDARERVQLIAEQAGREVQSDSTGLINLPGVIGLGAAIDYSRAIGIGKIETHNLDLRNRLFEMLGNVPQVRIVSPAPGPSASPLLTLQLPEGVNSREFIGRMLEKHQIALKSLPMLPNGLRFSMHLFNSMQDIERAVESLRIELS
ncbi:Isopenicillin N epimerase [Phycisphaerae bacterium RAS1]|nr:Isopenicillin N epimerase [Phycisphaerae bacterium RAS1]